jgi:cell wall-associated NlpC family hydrolase
MRLFRLLAVSVFAALVTLCFSQADKKVVLGKLGQALQPVAIKASPRTSAKTYYKVQPYEYLVIQSSQSKGWFKVLLENWQYGYVQANHIARLPYDVTADSPPPPSRATGSASSRAAAAADRGSQLTNRGIRYKWGGTDPSTGIDCSAFVKMLYGDVGMNLPRTAAEQAHVGFPVKRLEDLQKGDRLYFWSYSRNKVGHTGVYLGNGYFVHSSSGKGGVTTDFLGAKNWLKILVAARRSA